ncbi:MAG TPA: GNAT family N-acetyltransferase, partial [Rhodospirillaceae bacterium]|nr:GNAT family N-acetyltransferase [Rhodospirillaceae bacterium]
GGVVLNLAGPFEVEKAGNLMLERVGVKFPEARIDGFTVQRMANRAGAHEIIIGVSTDPIFGPVLMFGQGGTAVEIIHDFAIGLPPLNTSLARDLIERTRIAKLLHGYRDRPAVDLEAITLSLIKISQLIIDIPQIVELDINPLFADASGVIAVDARIRLDPASTGSERLAIQPYPKDLEEVVTLKNGRTVLLRPIRPEDEPNHHQFVSRLTPEDIRFRFFGLVGELPHTEMARLTQIDYDREMAFIAVPLDDGVNETWGVVRTMCDPDNEKAEFAVVVRSDLKDTGLGRLLMNKIIRHCKVRGTGQIVGQVLHDNIRMLKFIETLGFKRIRLVEGEIVEVALDLRGPA